MMADPAYRLILLDELNIVLRYDYLPIDDVVAKLTARRPGLHVVVTGRNAKDELIAAADLVTEMTMIKHPFRDGVKAQAGNRVLSNLLPSSRSCTPAIMFQGTGSDVGKSLIVAGLARAFHRQGLRGAALQAAEHVEQCGGDGRWRRDRPRPGPAGAGLRRGALGAYESRAAEAAERDRRPGRHPGRACNAPPRQQSGSSRNRNSCRGFWRASR